MARRSRFEETRLLGVDGNEEEGYVKYYYGVFNAADLEDQTVQEATPLREFYKVVPV